MMYIDDCLRSVMEMLEVPREKLKRRTYNIHAMSFTPKEIFEAVKKVMPEMTIEYQPDSRQNIGKSLESS
jgi:threonine 3-dehydrogenase